VEPFSVIHLATLTPYLFSILVSLALAFYGYRRRTVIAAKPFIAFAIGQALWTQGYVCELLATSLTWKIIWDSYQFIGMFTIAIAMLITAQESVQQKHVATTRYLVALGIIPLLVTLIALSEPLHHKLRTSARIDPSYPYGALLYDFTVIDYIGLIYLYFTTFYAITVLTKRFFLGNYLVRRQTLVLILGFSVPLILGSIFFFLYNPFPQRDTSPFLFLFCGLILGLGLFRVQLFNLLPIARETLFEEITDGVLVIDSNERIVDVNLAACRFLQTTESKVIGKSLSDTAELLKFTLPKDSQPKPLTKLLNANGQNCWLETTKKPVSDARAKPCGSLVILRDVTAAKQRELELEAIRETLEQKVIERTFALRNEIEQRKQVDAALVSSENRFRAIFNQSFQFVGILDRDGTLLDANQSALDLIDSPREAVVGRPFWDTPWWTHSNEHSARLRNAIHSASNGNFERFEVTHLSKHNVIHYVDFSLKPVLDDQNQVILIIPEGRDVTDLKRSERERQALTAKLQQAERLEALGRLAGGIAHDFNNLLTVIIGDISYLRDNIPHGIDEAEGFESALAATDRASSLTRQLLAFSRRQVVEPKAFPPAENLRQLQKLLERMVGETITLKLDIDSAPSYLFMDSSQFEQIIVNLVVNGRDAMPNGGTLTISLTNKPPDGKSPDSTSPKPEVYLTVTDTGDGIDESVLPHIFEPFFTTKGPNEGTGLGLATVHGIVTQATGRISVESKKGKGTCIQIQLPQCAAPKSSISLKRKVDTYPTTKNCVLVVEDQDNVRDLVTRSLIRFGFHTHAYRSGEVALEFFKRNRDTIDIVLTDVVMPDMNGRALADELRLIRPSIPIVFMSGHVDDGILRKDVEHYQEHYIAKPFTPNALAEKLNEVLAKTQ
jgi:PAS domain S-box-containing protein